MHTACSRLGYAASFDSCCLGTDFIVEHVTTRLFESLICQFLSREELREPKTKNCDENQCHSQMFLETTWEYGTNTDPWQVWAVGVQQRKERSALSNIG